MTREVHDTGAAGAGSAEGSGCDSPRPAARIAACVDPARIDAFQAVPEALAEARRRAVAGDLVLVFGSFQTVAEAMRVLRSEPAVSPDRSS